MPHNTSLAGGNPDVMTSTPLTAENLRANSAAQAQQQDYKESRPSVASSQAERDKISAQAFLARVKAETARRKKEEWGAESKQSVASSQVLAKL